MLEIDVDVGRLVALARDETLEQHAHARRIDFGDAERIAHRGVRRRTAALAEDVRAAREAHDVVHGEEVRLVVEFGDQREFVLDEGLRPCPARPRESAARGRLGERAQMAPRA